MTIKMYKSYWESVSNRLFAAILLSLFVCNGMQAAAASDSCWHLLRAAKQGDWEQVIDRIEEAGGEADLGARNQKGKTLLHLAAYEGQLEAVKCLVAREANLEARDNDGGTPLSYAASQGHLKVVKYLEKWGADINVVDNEGCTPLRWAAVFCCFDVEKYLLEQGAAFGRAKQDGTPSNFASLWISRERIEYLEDVSTHSMDLSSIHGEWRPENHENLPLAWRAALSTLVLLAKAEQGTQ